MSERLIIESKPRGELRNDVEQINDHDLTSPQMIIRKSHVTRRFLWGPLFLAAAILSSCGATADRRSVTIGVPALEQNALLYVAVSKGLLARQGVAATIRDFDSGPAAIAAMMSGQVDIASTAEFPFVMATMNGRQMRILAANDRFENDYIVARRDRGITRVSDLTGKKIGVRRGAITEFYLGRFLTLHGIRQHEITLVDVPPADFVASILNGHVDAIVAWQPFVSQMAGSMPDGLDIWPVQNGQAVYGLLVCRPEWLDGHEETVKRLLKGLAAGEDFLAGHQAESQSIVGKRLGYKDSYVASVWPLHGFSLTLDFSLVAAMEDEARWILESHVSAASEVPDFDSLIYPDGLTAARPEGVNLMQ